MRNVHAPPVVDKSVSLAPGIKTMLDLHFQFMPPQSSFVDVAELKGLLESGNSVRLFDTRAESEFKKGHIPGAFNVPASALPNMAVKTRENRGHTVVLYDYTNESDRTVKLVERLVNCGLSARMLSGGWEAWLKQDLPVEPVPGSNLMPGQFFDGFPKWMV